MRKQRGVHLFELCNSKIKIHINAHTHTHTSSPVCNWAAWFRTLWICFQMDWNQSVLDTLGCSVWQQAKTYHVLKMLWVWLQLLAFVIQLVLVLPFLFISVPPSMSYFISQFFSFISKRFTGIRLVLHCQSLLSHIASLTLCVCVCVCVKPQSC